MKPILALALAGWSHQQALLGPCPGAAGQGGLLCLEGEEQVQTQSLWQRFHIAAKPTKRPETYQEGGPDALSPSSDLQRVQ